MKWTVIDTIACPNTGIAFSSIVSLKMLKLVIWYEGDVIIPAGSTIEPFAEGIKIDGEYHPLKVYNITTLKLSVWREMKEKIKCPESSRDDDELCLTPFKCALKVCPYGKKRPQHSLVS
ncbi:anti-adapter protein IraM [Citrobacter sedlakii]|uniref:anti-adapter protein IraM n=1 Tax=Citrobacter TaxID=544 RepID=UPI001969FD6E|nr:MULTISPECIES: anti-adapter protein IraM [Citrobacter]MBM9566291.1 anti-adapter protein IraM [Citrobacter sedlakii]HBL4689100.1 anti-adapter protein IraM [Citrobacter sedlakii]HBL4703539.1 anti-adapter protein IraM [Citrobacter sedlakii]HBL4717637.1 anti-adapter protein IraM [Citrobacter sedlakii]HCA7838589.1 anti-adapter protein IraM [Citrobacter sedlakii]